MSFEERFKQISPAEFISKYREITGFVNPVRAIYQTIRELVENALDATETHGILPIIRIDIRKVNDERDYYKITVEDNGIGIPPNIVPEAFGRVLFSSKYVLRQTRGMYGLGVKAAVLYAQKTTGNPVEVVTSRPGLKFIYYFKLRIDEQKNEPVVLEKGAWRKNKEWHGTIVSLTIEGDWSRAKGKVLDYIRRTVIVAPYAELTLVTPENEVYHYERVIEKMPKPPRETKPHPLGVDLGVLKEIIESSNYQTIRDLLINSYQSIGGKTADDILEKSGIEATRDPKSLSDEEIQRLVNVMRNYEKYRAPSTKALSPLGPEIIIAGLKRMYNPEFVDAISRKPSVYSGNPFIVEVGIAYGGNVPMSSEESPEVLRYANKIPLIYDERNDVIVKVIRDSRKLSQKERDEGYGIDWMNYYVKLPAPILLLIHVCSTKIPFQSMGKESIADTPEFRREIKLAVLEAARKLKNYLSRKAREEELLKKTVSIAKYIPEVTRALGIISGYGEEELRNKLIETLVSRTNVNIDLVKKIVENVEIGV
uniref:Type 2 DNA topoisomerase 6 subunit B n=1 Tax=Staphylothermus marinus TaxID=2280 RepID=A0A7C4NUK5_STAMA